MHCSVLHAEVTQQLAETINLDEGREREREGGEGRGRGREGKGGEGRGRGREGEGRGIERERREIVTASKLKSFAFHLAEI